MVFYERRAVIEQPVQIGNFNIRSRDTTSEAREIALDMASSMDAESIPVAVYRQGQQYQAVGAVRFGLVARTLYAESAKKGASLDNIVSATNRPKDSVHISDIAEYMKAECATAIMNRCG